MTIDEAKAPWWRGAAIYQVYPRSFADASGDGVGDLDGLRHRLGHVAGLGVDAVWVSPFYRSPQADFGYDVADHTDVDPLFGTLADADALVGEAHRLGLRVIVDFVPGHTSSAHAWFRDSRTSRDGERADWYVWADAKPDGTAPNNWLSFFGGPAWQWEPRRGQYYLHHFHRAQPNLDLTVPEVVEAQLDVAAFWLERGIDGLRLDALPTAAHDPLLRDNPVQRSAEAAVDMGGNGANPILRQSPDFSFDRPHLMPFLERLRARAESFGPDRLLLAEVGNVNSLAVSAKYTRTGRHLHTCYHFLLLQERPTAALVRTVLERTLAALANGGAVTWATGNHDVVRLASRLEPLGDAALERVRLRTFVALVLSLEGGACLYQGDELGLPEATLAEGQLRDPYGIEFWPDFAGRDGCRTPMPWDAGAPHAGFSTREPWLPVPDAHRELAVSAQAGDPGSTLRFVRGFLHWRRGRPEIVRGTTALVPSAPDVVAFERRSGSARTLCLFNLGPDETSHAAEPALVAASGHGLDGGAVSGDGATVTLRPFGAFYGELPDDSKTSREAAAPMRHATERGA